MGPLHKQGQARWWARSETSLYCLYRTNMRNRERPVGKRENCQINDIHTQKGETSHPPDQPHLPPMSLCELPSTGGGKIKTTKVTFQTPETLVGKEESAARGPHVRLSL